MRTIELTAITALAITIWTMPTRAWSDEGEASIGVRLHGGAVALGVGAGYSETDRVPIVGIGLEGTYATSQWYEYRLSLSYHSQRRPGRYVSNEDGETATGDDVPRSAVQEAPTAELSRSGRFLRSEASITLHNGGPAWTPALHLGIGLHFNLGDGRDVHTFDAWGERNSHISRGIDLVTTVGLGLDHRVDAHWIVGASVLFQQVWPTSPRRQIGSVSFHISYYFYPNW